MISREQAPRSKKKKGGVRWWYLRLHHTCAVTCAQLESECPPEFSNAHVQGTNFAWPREVRGTRDLTTACVRDMRRRFEKAAHQGKQSRTQGKWQSIHSPSTRLASATLASFPLERPAPLHCGTVRNCHWVSSLVERSASHITPALRPCHCSRASSSHAPDV